MESGKPSQIKTPAARDGWDSVTALLGPSAPAIEAVRTERSSVTLRWGVHWTPAEIARDLLQNFFDGNRAQLKRIHIDVTAAGVVVRAPTSFDLSRLFFLGSEKTADDVGAFGEGFKAAVVGLLRDHGVTPIALSADEAVRICAGAVVPNTDLVPLEYEWAKLSRPFDGHALLLPGCPATIAAELQTGMQQFFSVDNPLLGRRLQKLRGVDVYETKGAATDGGIFYRHLLRARLPNTPLVFVFTQNHPKLDKLIARDRDRIAFGGDVLRRFLRVIVDRIARDLESEDWDDGHVERFFFNDEGMEGLPGERTTLFETVIERLRSSWEKGHPLCQLLASKLEDPSEIVWADGGTPPLHPMFQGYFARTSPARLKGHSAASLQLGTLEMQFVAAGLRPLPPYFVRLGALSAAQHLARMEHEARADRLRSVHIATPRELAALSVLHGVLAAWTPGVARAFTNANVRYSVGASDVLLGELREQRQWQSPEVYLSSSLFRHGFASALAIYLHEHAHIAGGDGSRGFTDALTVMLEHAIGAHADIPSYEATWLTRCEEVPVEVAIESTLELIPDVDPLEPTLDPKDQLDPRVAAELARDLCEELPLPELPQSTSGHGGQPPTAAQALVLTASNHLLLRAARDMRGGKTQRWLAITLGDRDVRAVDRVARSDDLTVAVLGSLESDRLERAVGLARLALASVPGIYASKNEVNCTTCGVPLEPSSVFAHCHSAEHRQAVHSALYRFFRQYVPLPTDAASAPPTPRMRTRATKRKGTPNKS